jgi:hypothetical protein
MTSKVNKDIAPDDIIRAVKSMKKPHRDPFLEDLLAATSPEYRASIREAPANYNAGRVKSH